MKLTKEQISYIENYIKNFKIKYYEVYMEILDHMILSVEDILEKDKEISFEEAVVKAKVEGFGEKGFKGMMDEKLKLAQSQARKQNNKMIKEYFTFPKIALTLTMFIVHYSILSFFEKPNLIHIIIAAIIVILGALQVIFYKNYIKINNLKVVKTLSLNIILLFVFSLFQLTNSILILGKESIDFNHILMRLFMSFIFTLSIISLLVYIEIRKKTVQELKTQIFV